MQMICSDSCRVEPVKFFNANRPPNDLFRRPLYARLRGTEKVAPLQKPLWIPPSGALAPSLFSPSPASSLYTTLTLPFALNSTISLRSNGHSCLFLHSRCLVEDLYCICAPETRGSTVITTIIMAPTKRSASKGDQTLRLRIASNLIGVVVLIASYYLYNLFVVPRFKWTSVHLHSQSDRLVFALRLQLPGLISLLIAILYVIVKRTTLGIYNPLTSQDSALDLQKKILSNTIEQFILSSFNTIVLASFLPEDKLRVLPFIAASFFIGRLAFFIGYSLNEATRSIGFSITIIPTLGALVYNVYFLATQGLTAKLGSSSVRP